jgi:hypothetical protein
VFCTLVVAHHAGLARQNLPPLLDAGQPRDWLKKRRGQRRSKTESYQVSKAQSLRASLR